VPSVKRARAFAHERGNDACFTRARAFVHGHHRDGGCSKRRHDATSILTDTALLLADTIGERERTADAGVPPHGAEAARVLRGLDHFLPLLESGMLIVGVPPKPTTDS
jgi:hypothetical protein